MRHFIVPLVLGIAVGAAAPAGAQSLSTFTQSAHGPTLGSATAAHITNVPIDTSKALQAPYPSTKGQGSFGYLSGLFRSKSASSFPPRVGSSNFPSQGASPNTNYQQLNWPYQNLFNFTGK